MRGSRERQHAGSPAKPYWWTRDDLPAIGADLDGAPELIGKVQVGAIVMLGDAAVDSPLGRLELRAGLEKVEGRPDRPRAWWELRWRWPQDRPDGRAVACPGTTPLTTFG
jgi:hypothetical protein